MNITISIVKNIYNTSTSKASDEVSTKKVDYNSIKNYLEELNICPSKINNILESLEKSLDENLTETKQVLVPLRESKGIKRTISIKFYITY